MQYFNTISTSVIWAAGYITCNRRRFGSVLPERLLINMFFIFMKGTLWIIRMNQPPAGRARSAPAGKHVNSQRSDADDETTNGLTNEICD